MMILCISAEVQTWSQLLHAPVAHCVRCQYFVNGLYVWTLKSTPPSIAIFCNATHDGRRKGMKMMEKSKKKRKMQDRKRRNEERKKKEAWRKN